MTSLLSRIGAYFVEPKKTDDAPRPPSLAAPPSSPGFVPPSSPGFVPRSSPGFLPPSSPGSAPRSSPGSALSLSRGSSPPPGASSGPGAASAAEGSAIGPGSARGSSAAHEAAPVVAGAAVLGAPGVVVPVAAACAGELRARARATAALLCIWRPVAPTVEPAAPVPAAQSPAGATTPGARRLAARLGAHGLPATACGRLAWLALDDEPAAAAGQTERCLIAAGVPVVLAVAGARPPAFERLLADLDLAIAVLPADIDPALRELAVATLRARERAVLPPLAPGPPRWAAMAGLARLRSLPRWTP
jgi:hypothetical protein